MPRFFMRMSFKGTAYAGWQIQENAMTVQEKLNYALSILLNQPISTIGCGRTDTGVHARQFYVHFDYETEISQLQKIVHQLNSILPTDISVQELFPVLEKQHSRFDAFERTYEYFITTSKNPFLKEFAMFCHNIPEMDLMNEACSGLLQQGDFSSFSKSNTQVKTNICHVSRASWENRNDLLVFTITADRFLRGMVRAVVGTLLEVGTRKIPPSRINEIIGFRNRSEAGVTVPACGLYLSQIKYPFIEPVFSPYFPS